MKRFVAFLVVLAGCGAESPGVEPDAGVDAAPDAYVDLSPPLFAPDHIVDVSITMAPADWDALRVQTRTIGSVIEGACLAQPIPSPFSTFHASITVDGTTLADVGVKKKGFIGSLNTEKPSLKVKFDEYVPGLEYLGLEKLTLNNSNQDPSYLRQCLTYPLFAAAGVVVPRCNFAHVRVNGTDLGIYVHVESVDHKLTKRRFADGTGPLYEGSLSDFRTSWVNTFDPKGPGDRADLMPITTVLETATDANLVAALAPHLDVDRFLTYWAMEIVTNHWDGYTNDKNNFFVYHDPTSGRLEFMPWGVDATFQPNATFSGIGSTTGPVAVAAAGMLPYRLFAMPAMRQQFLDRQRVLLATLWSEPALLAEIARMEALIAPIVDAVEGTAWHGAVNQVRQFVTGRRARLIAALDAGPTWPDPLPGYPCVDVAARVEGTFSTTYGTLGAANPLGTGTGTFSITIGGVTTVLTPVGATAGNDPNAPVGQPSSVIQVFGRRASDNHILVVSIGMRPSRFFPRAVDLGFFDASGGVYDYDPGTNTTAMVGFLLGNLTLTQAASSAGAVVAGSFAANADVQGMPPALVAGTNITQVNGTYVPDMSRFRAGPFALRVNDTRRHVVEDSTIAHGDDGTRTGTAQIPLGP